MEMSIERPAQATSYKLQATDSSYKLQDTSQPICKTLELPSYKRQATDFSDRPVFRSDISNQVFHIIRKT